MATAEFKTRRLPQSSTQASNNTGMPEHLNAANPHPQYLLVSDYAGGGAGSIDLSAYLTKVKYNEDQSAYNTWKSGIDTWKTNIDTWKSGIDTWKSDIDTWKTNIDTWKTTYGGYVDNLRSWKSNTADPAIEQVSQLATDLGNHVIRYSQNAAANAIVSHLDTEGKELYARRLHTHTLTDFNAAAADHKHDNDYLRINDVFNDRTTPNGNSVSALNSIFADINHIHSQYVHFSDLEDAGIYPSAKNLFDDSTASPSIDFNTILNQGIYNIHPQTGQSVLHFPGTSPNGFLVVIESQTVEGENSRDSNDNIVITTAGVSVVHQWLMCDNGTVKKRTITVTDAIAYAWTSSGDSNNRLYTKTAAGAASLAVYNTSDMGDSAGTTTAGSTTSITFNGTVYNRSTENDIVGSTIDYKNWYIISSPTKIKGIVNSGTAYTMNCSDYDIQKITLNNNCTLTISNVDSGRTVYLYVTADGSHSLTYNNVKLISSEDTGMFRIEFQHDGGAIRCINVMAILA